MLTCLACQREEGQTQKSGVVPQEEKRPAPCDIDKYHARVEVHFVQRTLVTLAKPTYPVEALERGVEGLVNVGIVVDSTGTVVKACALNGPEILHRAAEKAAMACKFKEDFGMPYPGRTSYLRDTLPYLFVIDPAKKVDEIHTIVVRPAPQ